MDPVLGVVLFLPVQHEGDPSVRVGRAVAIGRMAVRAPPAVVQQPAPAERDRLVIPHAALRLDTRHAVAAGIPVSAPVPGQPVRVRLRRDPLVPGGIPVPRRVREAPQAHVVVGVMIVAGMDAEEGRMQILIHHVAPGEVGEREQEQRLAVVDVGTAVVLELHVLGGLLQHVLPAAPVEILDRDVRQDRRPGAGRDERQGHTPSDPIHDLPLEGY